MSTEMPSTNARGMSMEQTQYAITNRQDINDRFAEKLIDWYFSKYSLNWETFLEAKRIAQITNNTSFVSKAFQFRMKKPTTEAGTHCS